MSATAQHTAQIISHGSCFIHYSYANRGEKKPLTLYQLAENLCLYYRVSGRSSELRTVIKTLIEFISYSILILHPYFVHAHFSSEILTMRCPVEVL